MSFISKISQHNSLYWNLIILSPGKMHVRSIFAPDIFRGKVAIVTGGATGIGAAIAHELCYLGCNVMIASRKEERLKEAENRMKQNEQLIGDVSWTKCNIRQEEDVKNLMKTTLEKYGQINFLVNNGGGQFLSMSENITAKGWHGVIETNLTGTFYCCKHAYLSWMREHGGAIVNIIADIWRGIPGMAHTSSARAGVDNLTKTLALEWAKSGVRINSIAPAVIDSPTARANYPPKVFDLTTQQIPAWRLGTPEEMAAATCFLLSPGAEYVTGVTLKVDGGESLYGNFTKSVLEPAVAYTEELMKAKNSKL